MRLAAAALALATACAHETTETRPAAAAGGIVFTEVDPAAAGIDFVHRHGGSGQKYLPETMGSGVALFDADGDGDLDVYFLQGAPMPGTPAFDDRSRFYRNEGGWRFRDDTDASGLAHAGYAMGAAVADIDNDGDLDVYVSAWGRGHLFVNRGDARFDDATEASGIAAEGFLASAAFGDVDGDGLVDLYVVGYVDAEQTRKNPYCGKHEAGGRAYCTPHAFKGAPDFLYLNRGGGRFEDVSAAAGVARGGPFDGKGLGVVMSDLDLDGDLDVAVANDSCANFLYRNDGGARFSEEAMLAGFAFGEDGRERAGMGIDAADVDGDGRPDLFVTNLNDESYSLYRNRGGLSFEDRTMSSGLGGPSRPFVGFGCGLVDLDGDGDLDVLAANGHILDNAELFGDVSPYRERPLAFENDGTGSFRVLPATPGFLSTPRVLRGLAFGDLDGDGDLDAVATCNEGPPVLLRNDGSPRNGRVVLRLIGAASNRAGIGARVRWWCGNVERAAEARTAFSYLSASDGRVVLGTGSASRIDRIEVRWPSGHVTTLRDVARDQEMTVREEGAVEPKRPLGPRR
ncbi:MAG TPA: CRTAC1 family protein [Planctomycetota bacterium]|nr:CRTAC1 family protein [Planctomycetota bacterium]